MTHEKSARLEQTRLPFRGKRRVVPPLVPRGCCDALQGACKTTGRLADLATLKTTRKAHTTDEIAFRFVSVAIQAVSRNSRLQMTGKSEPASPAALWHPKT
ncbi:hypothetical protein MTO96_034671 [Rhipicephalus appendiculatus]